MYADDVTTSFCTREERLEFYFESEKCLKEGGFALRKWNSNNKELMDKVCVEENEKSYEQGKIGWGLERYQGLIGTLTRTYLSSILIKLFH